MGFRLYIQASSQLQLAKYREFAHCTSLSSMLTGGERDFLSGGNEIVSAASASNYSSCDRSETGMK